jgi:hypothetical protein
MSKDFSFYRESLRELPRRVICTRNGGNMHFPVRTTKVYLPAVSVLLWCHGAAAGESSPVRIDPGPGFLAFGAGILVMLPVLIWIERLLAKAVDEARRKGSEERHSWLLLLYPLGGLFAGLILDRVVIGYYAP